MKALDHSSMFSWGLKWKLQKQKKLHWTLKREKNRLLRNYCQTSQNKKLWWCYLLLCHHRSLLHRLIIGFFILKLERWETMVIIIIVTLNKYRMSPQIQEKMLDSQVCMYLCNPLQAHVVAFVLPFFQLLQRYPDLSDEFIPSQSVHVTHTQPSHTRTHTYRQLVSQRESFEQSLITQRQTWATISNVERNNQSDSAAAEDRFSMAPQPQEPQ